MGGVALSSQHMQYAQSPNETLKQHRPRKTGHNAEQANGTSRNLDGGGDQAAVAGIWQGANTQSINIREAAHVAFQAEAAHRRSYSRKFKRGNKLHDERPKFHQYVRMHQEQSEGPALHEDHRSIDKGDTSQTSENRPFSKHAEPVTGDGLHLQYQPRNAALVGLVAKIKPLAIIKHADGKLLSSDQYRKNGRDQRVNYSSSMFKSILHKKHLNKFEQAIISNNLVGGGTQAFPQQEPPIITSEAILKGGWVPNLDADGGHHSVTLQGKYGCLSKNAYSKNSARQGLWSQNAPMRKTSGHLGNSVTPFSAISNAFKEQTLCLNQRGAPSHKSTYLNK